MWWPSLVSASWWTSVPKQTINRPNYTSHSKCYTLHTPAPHCPEYVLKKNTTTKVNSEDLCLQCALDRKSLQKKIDLAVCGTLWYVSRNAQLSPGGRRRRCRFNVELARWVSTRGKTAPVGGGLSVWGLLASGASQLANRSHTPPVRLSSSSKGFSLHTYQKGLMPTILVTHPTEEAVSRWMGLDVYVKLHLLQDTGFTLEKYTFFWFMCFMKNFRFTISALRVYFLNGIFFIIFSCKIFTVFNKKTHKISREKMSKRKPIKKHCHRHNGPSLLSP